MREKVSCSFCGSETISQTWNYGKNRPVEVFFCNKHCKGLWQKQQRENLGFTKEWLVSEYFDKRKSTYQIAKEIGRDPKRVWEWIKDYGLDARPRGNDNHGYPFKKGEPSAFKGKKHTPENREIFRQLRLADGRLPCYVNGVHWMKYYGRHPASWKGGVTPERQAVYSSIEWADAVKQVWHRDNAYCKNCGKHHNQTKIRGTFHIHHIVSFMVKELRCDPNNLVLLCSKCHRWVHSNKNTNKLFIEETL